MRSRRGVARTTAALLVVVSVVIAITLILSVVLFASHSGASGTPLNLPLDRYPANSSFAGQYGDEPYVAHAPNGTIYVAWIGFDFLGPPATPGGLPNFTTAIWLSSSGNGGVSYTEPTRLSPPVETYSFDPSIAILPGGSVVVAWLNSSSPDGYYSVMLATQAPGAPGFHLSVAVSGSNLDRPWICSSSNGTMYLVYDVVGQGGSGFTYWMVSYNAGQTFGPPRVLMTNYVTGAVVAGPSGMLYAAGFSESTNFSGGPVPAIYWVGSVDTLTGQSSMVSLATTYLPYDESFSLTNESHPGPALALVGGAIVVVYAANNASELVSRSSNDGGHSWSPPVVLEQTDGALYFMPWATPVGSSLALAWESTVGGSWNTYSALYNGTTGPLHNIRLISSEPGYPDSVLNWHGDFLGAVATGPQSYIVTWGDGRGLPSIYGLGHIYIAAL